MYSPAKVLFLLFIMVVVFFLPLSVTATKAESLRVAICDNPPVTFVDQQGVAHGIFVDVLEEIAEKESYKLEYISGTWAESLDKLYNGECDVLPAIAYAQWREKRTDFAKETVLSNWGKIYRRTGLHIDSILDLKNLTVAVMSDDIYFAKLVKLLASFSVKCKFVSYKSYNEAVAAVGSRQADVAVVSRFVTIDKKYDGVVSSTSIVFAPIELRFGFKKGIDEEVVNTFDRHIRAMKSDEASVYFSSLTKWVGASSEVRRDRNIWTVSVIGISVLLVGFVFVFLAARDKIHSGKERRRGDRRADDSRRSVDQVVDKVQAQAQNVVENIADAIVVVGFDDQKIKFTSGGFYNLFGYKSESVTDSEFSRLVEKGDEFLSHLENCRHSSESGDKAAENSVSERFFDFKAVHCCGHVFDVQCACSISAGSGDGNGVSEGNEKTFVFSLRPVVSEVTPVVIEAKPTDKKDES